MSYLYGLRYKAEENELIHSLRQVRHVSAPRIDPLTSTQELYTQDYDSIDWPAQRNNVSKADVYMPHTGIFDFLNQIIAQYELCAIPPVRLKAVDRCYELLVMEDENTDCQDLGPVNKMMNQICRIHREGRESDAYKRHMHRRADFMWLGAQGMMMSGTNGSQLWDISFVCQAIVESGMAEEEGNRESCIQSLRWLDQAQIQRNPKHHAANYRHATKGAWPFSTPTQGYTVSDCTGEGLKAALYLQKHLE